MCKPCQQSAVAGIQNTLPEAFQPALGDQPPQESANQVPPPAPAPAPDPVPATDFAFNAVQQTSQQMQQMQQI